MAAKKKGTKKKSRGKKPACTQAQVEVPHFGQRQRSPNMALIRVVGDLKDAGATGSANHAAENEIRNMATKKKGSKGKRKFHPKHSATKKACNKATLKRWQQCQKSWAGVDVEAKIHQRLGNGGMPLPFPQAQAKEGETRCDASRLPCSYSHQG